MPTRRHIRTPNASPDLFRTPMAIAEGFRYAPELLTPQAEQEFVAQFEKLPFKPFDFHGYQGNRRASLNTRSLPEGLPSSFGPERLRPKKFRHRLRSSQRATRIVILIAE